MSGPHLLLSLEDNPQVTWSWRVLKRAVAKSGWQKPTRQGGNWRPTLRYYWHKKELLHSLKDEAPL